MPIFGNCTLTANENMIFSNGIHSPAGDVPVVEKPRVRKSVDIAKETNMTDVFTPHPAHIKRSVNPPEIVPQKIILHPHQLEQSAASLYPQIVTNPSSGMIPHIPRVESSPDPLLVVSHSIPAALLADPIRVERADEIIVLDLETTGLHPHRHRVIEVGAVLLRGGQVGLG
jgi:DNA polymerase III epsilon subunit-like protein